jgi:MFS family permease
MIFFGWYIVAASILLTGYHSAMFVYGLTAFLTPIATTTGWTYAQISLATSIRGLQVGALDPVAGLIVDRWPARRLMLLGTVVFATGTICVSQAPNLAVFYIGFLIVGLGSAFIHNMVPMTMVARWFKKNVGKASGILYMGVAIGGLFVPLIVKAIDTYGWQDVMLYMGFGSLIIGLPLSLLFRNSPEEHGLLPDGKKQGSLEGPGDAGTGYGLREAARTRTFWMIGLVGMFQITAVHAVTIHTIPYLTSVGMERSVAAIGVTIFSLVGLVVRVVYGILADMFIKKYIYALSNAVTTAALILFGLLSGNSIALMALFGVVYGLGVSGAMPLRVPIVREYFGVKSFGAIYGIMSVFTVVGSVIGAPLAGWVYDTRFSYFPIWFVFAGLTAVGTILLLILPRPVAVKGRFAVSG